MKKQKTNKRGTISKITARVMLVVLLLTSALSFSACGEPNCEEGDYYSCFTVGIHPDNNLALKIISNHKAFPIDDVTLKFCVGFKKNDFSIGHLFSYMLNPSGTYTPLFNRDITIEDSEDNLNTYFVIYAINEVDVVFDDPYGLTNATILKEVSYDEVHQGNKYDFTWVPFAGYYFNYCEDITIPLEVLIKGLNDESYSWLYIGICETQKSPETGEYILPRDSYAERYFYSVTVGVVSLAFDFRNTDN